MIKIHNAAWPGVVGKGMEGDEETISLRDMLSMTAAATSHGEKFDGIDINLMPPHADASCNTDQVLQLADLVQSYGLDIGSVGAPVWHHTGGGSAMGSEEHRKQFLASVKKTCAFAATLNKHGVRKYGIIRIDSADSPENWASNPKEHTKTIARTFREAAQIASDYGERLAAEGEICWAGMHSWRHMLHVLEEANMPGTLGFLADLAHTYLYLLGYNAPEDRLLNEGYTDEEFYTAYERMTGALGPWTFDVHIAQSNGTVYGSGLHDKTGRHCTANAPDGKLDIVQCARYWLLDEHQQIRNNIQHICWDGCMFPNAVLKSPDTWRTILKVMISVRDDVSALAAV